MSPYRRRWFLIGTAALAAVACGLEVVGTPAITSDVADGGPIPSSPPGDDGMVVNPGDAVVPVDADDRDKDGGAPDAQCVSDGSFCDPCDPSLVLCLRFDGGAVDESPFHRRVDFFDGGPKPDYISDKGLGALSLDGKLYAIVPAGVGLDDVNALTAEFFARVKRPAANTRIAFFDGNAIGSFFLYGGEGPGNGPHLRCNNTDIDAGKIYNEWAHYTCVSHALADGGGSIAIYVDGGRLNGADLPASSPTGSTGEIYFFADHPTGKDGLIGDIATVRIFRRAKDDEAVRKAAGL